MMKKKSIVMFAVACMTTGATVAQVSKTDSVSSERTLRTEQEYIKHSETTQDTMIKRNAAQDSLQLRIVQDSTRVKKTTTVTPVQKNTDTKPMNRDTTRMRTTPPPHNSGVQSAPQDKTEIKAKPVAPATQEKKEITTEKKKTMYLVPDSTVNKVATPE